MTALYLVVATVFSGEASRELGFSGRNLLRSSFVVVAAAAIVCCATLWMAARLGVLHAPSGVHEFIRRFWGYAVWSFAQQFLLQDFFLLRFRKIISGHPGLSVLAAAGIFAFAHLPNPLLTAFTLVWGLISCFIFERFRNLYPLGVAHAMLGITVAIALPGSVTHNMHVGLGYFHYQHGPPHRRVSDHTVSTSVWVNAEAPTLRS